MTSPPYTFCDGASLANGSPVRSVQATAPVTGLLGSQRMRPYSNEPRNTFLVSRLRASQRICEPRRPRLVLARMRTGGCGLPCAVVRWPDARESAVCEQRPKCTDDDTAARAPTTRSRRCAHSHRTHPPIPTRDHHLPSPRGTIGPCPQPCVHR